MFQRFVVGSLILSDMAAACIAPVLALYILFDGAVGGPYFNMIARYIPEFIIIRLVIFYFFRLYNRLWRYASVNELLAIIGAVTVGSLIVTAYMYIGNSYLPKSIAVLTWFFNIVFVGASRLFIRILSCLRQQKSRECTRVLIIGAGDAGAMIAREIQLRYYKTKKVVGFIDDDEYKYNQMLFGTKVLGTRHDIQRIVSLLEVSEIIIAIPSKGGDILREIIQECKKTNCEVKTIPGIYELINGKVTVQQLRNIDLEDLLRRDSVKLNLTQIAGYLTGKRVLVTGAGGSIGSELCRQIAKMAPSSLTLLGKGENSIYDIHYELREKYADLMIEPVIADVRDSERIHTIFAQVKPQVVFHAAAHKHVPLMESQPIEAVNNNIFGTKTVAEAADRAKTEVFVMISTDKAVNPSSVMGATKRVAELIIQYMSIFSNTKFVAVRFGNVLGSRGSVIPLFKKQIAKGGPITITHPDMQRYFMTIPEASQLVLQAGAIAKGGEVFVLDMGEPVKIVDMACDLIELSGLVPHKDIKIKYTGLRPGEKLFEELLTAEEGTNSTRHEKIFVANLKAVSEEKLQRALLALQLTSRPDKITEILSGLIPTYQPSHEKRYALEVKELKLEEKNQVIKDIVQYQAVSELH